MKKSEWSDELMLHDWPEMGPGSLSLEDLYQMFKKRLAEEDGSSENGEASR